MSPTQPTPGSTATGEVAIGATEQTASVISKADEFVREAKNAEPVTWLRAPYGEDQIVAWFGLMLNRYLEPLHQPSTNREQEAARQLGEYIVRAIDRQLNKARGLLTYNSVLVAAFNQARSKLEKDFNHIAIQSVIGWKITLFAAVILALLACAPLLRMMFVTWGDPNRYKTHLDAAFEVFKVECSRTHLLTISALFSILATLVGAAPILYAITTSRYFVGSAYAGAGIGAIVYVAVWRCCRNRKQPKRDLKAVATDAT